MAAHQISSPPEALRQLKIGAGSLVLSLLLSAIVARTLLADVTVIDYSSMSHILRVGALILASSPAIFGVAYFIWGASVASKAVAVWWLIIATIWVVRLVV